MKQITDKQLENDLSVFSAMQQVDSPDLFYTRLHVRMAKDVISHERETSIKYVIVISTLTIFLCMHFLLSKQRQILDITTNDQRIEAFSAAYDQTI